VPFSLLFGQTIELGAPYCENLLPSEIGFGGANYSITQDMLGNMYFGNFNGILTYNTLNWGKIDYKGKPILFRDKLGHIYVGGFNQFGEFNLDNNDNAHYVPITDSSFSFGQVEQITSFRNQIFFTANNTLYKVIDKDIQQIGKDSLSMKIFVVRDKMYVSTSSHLYLYENEELIPFLPAQHLVADKIFDVFRFADKTIIRTQNNFYSIGKKNEISVFKTEIDVQLNEYNYSCAIRLSNDILCVGTKQNGLYFIDNNGALVDFLNKESGLYDNAINALFIDKANHLWVAFSNGIGRVEFPSAFTYYNASQGMTGKVQTIVRHKGDLFVGTDKGIFELIKTNKNLNVFENIEPKNISCTSLKTLNGNLFAATNNGLYKISTNSTELLFKGNIQALALDTIKSQLWFCTVQGAYKLDLLNSSNSITSFGFVNGGLKTIAIDTDGTVWFGSFYNGIYKIDDNKIIEVVPTGLPSNISWVDVYSTSLGVVFSTQKGLFRYDSEIHHFYNDSKISVPLDCANSRISPIVEDEKKNLWLAFVKQGMFENQIAVAWSSESIEQYTLITSQFNKLMSFMCSTIYPDNNSVVWFGGFDGLVRLDFKQLNSKRNPEQTLIHKIVIGEDSVFTNYKKSNSETMFVFDYDYNSIRFDYATPIYENKENIKYTYILEGYSSEWSTPKHVTYKEYSSLPAGKYIFRVKAYDTNGNVTQESAFNFKIEQHPMLRWWAILLYIALAISFLTIFLRWRAYQFVKEKTYLSKVIQSRTEELLLEKEKTETLLSNILPEETAKELKEKGRATSMRFNMATILFSDIQGFTKIAEDMNPDTLIDELDRFFLEFDKIVEKHNIEKIKTIGDAYMCAGGIPQKNRTNPIEVVVAALEMQYRVKMLQKEYNLKNQDYWGLRIGIHTGPIIAGVVGSKKFSYDIWGDSVNIASRMESSGEVGKVNVSESTYVLIQEFFDCEYRGKMPVKYKGEIDMYFVKGFKARFTEDPLKILPNNEFTRKFALLKFDDLQEVMFERLQKELPENLYYHNLKHTIDVTVQTEIIALEEKVTDEEMFLLKTAALFHDAGFLLGYSQHEDMSAQLARNILPKYKYLPEQISTICELIAVTKLPHNPKNKIEEIICDADLDYLGRDDYLPVSRDLYRELIEQGIIKKSEAEWNKMQIKFLQNHKFFTQSSKRRRNAKKNIQIELLQEQTKSFNRVKK